MSKTMGKRLFANKTWQMENPGSLTHDKTCSGLSCRNLHWSVVVELAVGETFVMPRTSCAGWPAQCADASGAFATGTGRHKPVNCAN